MRNKSCHRAERDSGPVLIRLRLKTGCIWTGLEIRPTATQHIASPGFFGLKLRVFLRHLSVHLLLPFTQLLAHQRELNR